MTKILVNFRHGLGDATAFTIALKHIKKYRPDWEVDVISGWGKHTSFGGLCNRSLILHQDNPPHNTYNKVFNIVWPEAHEQVHPEIPPSKVGYSLEREFGIHPDPSLFYYQINVPKKNKLLASNYIRNFLPDHKGIVTIHYQGNSSQSRKNINENIIRDISNYFISLGYILLIFDWDGRNAIKDNRIFCPSEPQLWENCGTGNSATIAALISFSDLFIGIDSGPLHVAGATSTPSIGIWTEHHPAHFYEFSHNVVHLVPHDLKRWARGRDKNGITNFFEKHYKHKYYDKSNLTDVIIETSNIALNKQPIIQKILPPPKDLWKNKTQRISSYQYWAVGKDKTFTF